MPKPSHPLPRNASNEPTPAENAAAEASDPVDEHAATEETAADTQPPAEPANRAERRAQRRNRGKPPRQWPDNGQRLHGRGPVAAPRNYGTRRSG